MDHQRITLSPGCKTLFTITSIQPYANALLNTLVAEAKSTSNGGFHLNGFILIPTNSRLREDFASHINERQDLYVDHIVNGRPLYDRGGIERVHVKPIDFNRYRVSDYSLKTVKAGKVDYDTTIILPRTRKEMRPNIPFIDARARVIKNIQGATNMSDELAIHVYNGFCRKRKIG
jgi:hypothetical protein